MSKFRNLNDIEIRSDGEIHAHDRRSDAALNAHVEMHVTDLEQRLVREISSHPIVVGCMAWLTNEPILNALASRQQVSMIVQKEDFLRPDSGDWSAKKLQSLYRKIPEFSAWDAQLGYNFASQHERPGVRCVGYCVSRSAIPPRMHHKFMVFCDSYFEPVCVWTGSFNATNNATRSLENAVVIRNKEIARAYFTEWVHVLGLSECLNWETDYVSPEYKLGT